MARATTVTISLAAPSIDLLLFDWLGDLIFRKDRDRMVFPETSVTIAQQDEWTLSATLPGGPIDPERVALGRLTAIASGTSRDDDGP